MLGGFTVMVIISGGKILRNKNLLLMQQFFWWQGGLTYRSWKTNLVLDIRTADPRVRGGEGAHRLAIEISRMELREKIFDLGEPNFQNGGPDIHGGAHGALEVVVPARDNCNLKKYFIAIFSSTLVKY